MSLRGQSPAEDLIDVGIGLRSAHMDTIIETQPAVPWFEILLDNHTARGGLIPAQLVAVRNMYALSMHCVGMSLGGIDPLDMEYLRTVERMLRQFKAMRVSDHLCFTNNGQHYFNDLLPIPFTDESLRHVCGRIEQVQDVLGTQLLVENVSSYLQYEDSVMNEAEFMSALVDETGCGILLDINNAYVNEYNHGFPAKDFIDSVPLDYVGEVHLAGYQDHSDYLIDAHNNRVSEPVWGLFDYYLEAAGDTAPVLIEWDNDIPSFDVLLDEAKTAQEMINRRKLSAVAQNA